jgi:hypothetical protein
MRYSIKFKNKIYEVLLLLIIVVAIAYSHNFLLLTVLVFLGFALLKDIIFNWNLQYVTDDEVLFIESRNKIKKIIKYKNIEFITISRRNKKYIAIGNEDVVFLLKDDIENRRVLVQKVLSKAPKKAYIHENVTRIIDLYDKVK